MKSEIVTKKAKDMLDILTVSLVDFVEELTIEIENGDEGSFDWEIFLNTNMIMINGLMHHYIENHLKVLPGVDISDYIAALDDNLNRIKLYYAETRKEIN